MTRARILKPAQQHARPAPQPARLHGQDARLLPWLHDSPSPDRPRRRRRRRLVPLARQARANALALAESAAALLGRALATARSHARAATGPAPDAATRLPAAPLTLRQRAALLLAIITVPAMAAPGDLALFAAPEPAVPAPDPLALAAAQALPFERPGMSFPGSAFFFLDDPPASGTLVALPTPDPLDTGAETGRALGEFIRTGPAAKPFLSTGAGISHARAQTCLAQAVWYEAASESEAGQRAVAQVVLNRVAHPSWPASVCGVVYQGSEREAGCQFTFTCDGSLARRPSGASWARAQRIAAAALAGEVYAPVGHATHYHTLWVDPYWARRLDHVGTIGAHRFYRNRGAGGEKAAFSMAYAGFEPAVSGRPLVRGSGDATSALPAASIASKSALANSGRLIAESSPERSAERNKGKGKAAAAPESAPGGLEISGDILPEFADVGQWKGDPASFK